eukprot:Nk52_evm59s1020 gene=Nk52_evmTU59s1020
MCTSGFLSQFVGCLMTQFFKGIIGSSQFPKSWGIIYKTTVAMLLDRNVKRVYGNVDEKTILQTERNFLQSAPFKANPSNRSVRNMNLGGVPCVVLEHSKKAKENSNCIKGPVCVYAHGGSFSCMTARDFVDLSNDLFIKGIDKRFTVVIVDYSLVPEAAFPIALNQMTSVYNHLLTERCINPSFVMLSGDSAGGNLCLSTLLECQNKNIVHPACLAIISPWLRLDETCEEMSKLLEKYPWDYSDPRFDSLCARIYANGKALDNPLISPFYGSDQFSSCPILIHAGLAEFGEPCMRQFSELVNSNAGPGTVTYEAFQDEVHDFHQFPDSPHRKESIRKISAFVRQHIILDKDISPSPCDKE